MFDSIKEKLEEYIDYLYELNASAIHGIHTLKDHVKGEMSK